MADACSNSMIIQSSNMNNNKCRNNHAERDDELDVTVQMTPNKLASPVLTRTRRSAMRSNTGKRKRQEKSTDRYIPNRNSTDVDLIHHLLTTKKPATETPAKKSDKVPRRCLFSVDTAKKTCFNKLLSFTNNAKRKLDFTISETECNLPKITKSSSKVKEDTALKILNAPGASKNFYYNLVDWGHNNIVVIGLKEDVYYWDAVKSQAYVLPPDSSAQREGDLVTCVRWKPDATKHTVSHRYGATKLWDSTVCKLVSSLKSPTVYSSSWASNNLVTMGRGDGTILNWDIRTASTTFTPSTVTSGIICGLEWNPEGESLAVGCNDNKVQILRSTHLRHPDTLTMVYQSAVKALSWHPLKRGILATGSGQNDQRAVIWDIVSGTYKNCIDTKSQVTGVIWSPNCKDLLTSHGHFDPNLRVWNLKDNENTHKLTGHTNMVVSVSKSPLNDHHLISLSADESLRVWNVWNKVTPVCRSKQSSSLLSLDKIR